MVDAKQKIGKGEEKTSTVPSNLGNYADPRLGDAESLSGAPNQPQTPVEPMAPPTAAELEARAKKDKLYKGTSEQYKSYGTSR